MEKKELNLDILKALSEPLPKAAIQRTKGSVTRKRYDTDGYGYQFAVDRFNNVLGTEWGYSWEVIEKSTGQYKSGQPYISITVSISIWILDPTNTRTHAGGHTSAGFDDALKGAITSGFKKTAAMWGVGRDAYAGTIDDDNKPMPDEHANKEADPETEKIIKKFREKIEGAKTRETLEEVGKEIGDCEIENTVKQGLHAIYVLKMKIFNAEVAK